MDVYSRVLCATLYILFFSPIKPMKKQQSLFRGREQFNDHFRTQLMRGGAGPDASGSAFQNPSEYTTSPSRPSEVVMVWDLG